MIKSELISVVQRNTRNKGNTNAYPVADIVTDLDLAFNSVVAEIMDCSDMHQWDDSNYSFLPISTTDLEDSSTNPDGLYNFKNVTDSDGTHEVLRVQKVWIKNQSGDWVSLRSVDQNDPNYDGLLNSDPGTPTHYDKVGMSIKLLPNASYSSLGGLRIQNQRLQKSISELTNDEEPGFNPLFHEILTDEASARFWRNRDQRKYAQFKQSALELTARAKEFYGRRGDDDALGLVMDHYQHI